MNFKFIYALALVSSFSLFSLSANAEAVFSGQANLTNITNGSLTNINDTTAQINVNSGVAGATVNWNTLNVPQDNTLNFYFPDANQYALNKVANGLTTIAGKVGYADGSQAGTVIFSNPNGIVCTGTSVINVASMLLTTHDVTMKDNIAQLTKQVGKDGNYHGVSMESGSMLNLDNNLTVVSLGIDIDGANITSGNDTVMVTADGANYVLASKETVAVKNSTVSANDVYFGDTKNTDNYAIKVANSAIKTTDGKLYLTSTADDGSVKLYRDDITSDIDVFAKNEAIFSGEFITYNGGYKAYYPSFLYGKVQVKAPNVTIDNGFIFTETLDIYGLEKLSSEMIGMVYGDLYISTYSEEMATDIFQVIDDHIYNFGMLTIDIVPRNVENGVINNIVKRNDTILANKNLLSSYTNLISTNDKNTETIQKNNNILIKAFAADDYKEDFLRNSVKKDSNGNIKTTDLFKM